MKTKTMKRIGAYMAASLLLVNSSWGNLAVHAETSPAAVDSKEEVVYSLLQADGTVNETHVVNILNISKEGIITDYGSYDSIKNLTNTEELALSGNKVSGLAGNGRFYYQGSLNSAQLPWNVQIDYKLDGQTVSAAEIGGQSGHLEMRLRTSENSKGNSAFYENYMLQISVTLDSDVCTAIVADGATFANAGNDKLLTFTVMPGTDGDITIEADVNEFEMAPVSIAAILFSMDSFGLELDGVTDMVDGFTDLTDAIEQLNDGVKQLNDGEADLNDGMKEINSAMKTLSNGIGTLYTGASSLATGIQQMAGGASELAGGAGQLSSGSGQFKAGLNELSGKSSELTQGSSAIYQALQSLSGSLSNQTGSMDLSQLAALPAGLRQIAAGLDEVESGLSSLSGGFSQSYSALDSAINAIPSATGSVNDTAVGSLYAYAQEAEDSAAVAALTELINNYTAAQTVKGTYSQVSPAFAAVNQNLSVLAGSVRNISDTLYGLASQMETALQSMDVMEAISQLTAGISQLTASYGEFHEGLKAYTSGVTELASAYSEVDEGIRGIESGSSSLASGTDQIASAAGELASGIGQLASGSKTLADGTGQLADGTTELGNGINELYDGTTQLYEETKDLPNEIENAIDDLLASYDTSDFEPVSFVASENTDITSVQFVIQVEGIEKPEVEAENMIEEENDTFWSRFTSLFGF